MFEGVFEHVNLAESHGVPVTTQPPRCTDMSDLWERLPSTTFTCRASEAVVLFKQMQRYGARSGVEEACAQGTCSVVIRGRGKRAREDDWSTKSCVERWHHDLPKTWELCGSALCTLPSDTHINGSQGRVCDGASLTGRARIRSSFAPNGSRTSRGSQSDEQCTREPGVVYEQSRSQAVRASRFTRADLARIEPFHLRGLVWCVSVPTGAFVARRNGKIFVTGNSGFPKSLDVSKALDKEAGAERKVVGHLGNALPRTVDRIALDYGGATGKAKNGLKDGYAVTVAATDAARTWQGYGTALKPAHEPAVFARKPLEGTVAANVTKWGVGALAIDACRIPSGKDHAEKCRSVVGLGSNRNGHAYGEWMGVREDSYNEAGRWPANVLLDEEAGALLDVQTGILTSGRSNGFIGDVKNSVALGKKRAMINPETVYGDSGGASRFFYCSKVSKKERGEGNNHPTVKPIDLCTYLAKLIRPQKPGAILVPFAGSGSEMIGARRAGWNRVVGIEREQEYVDIALARIAREERSK